MTITSSSWLQCFISIFFFRKIHQDSILCLYDFAKMKYYQFLIPISSFKNQTIKLPFGFLKYFVIFCFVLYILFVFFFFFLKVCQPNQVAKNPGNGQLNHITWTIDLDEVNFYCLGIKFKLTITFR